MEDKLTNLEYLHTTCNGDHEMVEQIVQMFKEGTSQLMTAIVKNWMERNLEDLKRNTHKAKSSFRMLGATITADKLEEIELGVSTLSDDKIDILLKEIGEETYSIFLELQNQNTTSHE